MNNNKYANQVEFIKAEFSKYYQDRGPENGILQGTKYAGAATHARNCLRTLVKMLHPTYALEIGSMHYESSDAIAETMDDIYGIDGKGLIDTFDIKYGGYTGETHLKPKNKRVRPGYWYPFATAYDSWKLTDPLIAFPAFKTMTDDEIRQANEQIISERVKDFKKYDLIFIDGDHSFKGAKEDFELALKFSHKDTVLVFDNVWDSRLHEVRKFMIAFQILSGILKNGMTKHFPTIW